MTGWKVDRRLTVWMLVFAALAIPTGMFLLRAVEGGFLAEGFFLISLSWIILFFLVAKLVNRLMRDGEGDGL